MSWDPTYPQPPVPRNAVICRRPSGRVQGGQVQAALGLVGPGPTTGPGVLAGRHRPRAGRASDRKVAALEQWMIWERVPVHVGSHVAVRPVDEWADLVAAVLEGDGLHGCALRRLVPADAGDPGAGARERSLERRDLVQVTAGVGVRAVQLAVPGQEPVVTQLVAQVADREPEPGSEVVAELEGLGEVEARVQEEDRHVRSDAG